MKPSRSLRDLWSQKLEDSGFVDVEDVSRPDSPLKAWHSFRWRATPQQKSALTIEYYLRAADLLITYNFDNDTHKTIWQLHCEGKSKRKIEKLIATCEPNYKREQIGNIINFIASSIL